MEASVFIFSSVTKLAANMKGFAQDENSMRFLSLVTDFQSQTLDLSLILPSHLWKAIGTNGT